MKQKNKDIITFSFCMILLIGLFMLFSNLGFYTPKIQAKETMQEAYYSFSEDYSFYITKADYNAVKKIYLEDLPYESGICLDFKEYKNNIIRLENIERGNVSFSNESRIDFDCEKTIKIFGNSSDVTLIYYKNYMHSHPSGSGFPSDFDMNTLQNNTAKFSAVIYASGISLKIKPFGKNNTIYDNVEIL